MVMEPMQGKLAPSQFDFGYTEQFCIPGVTSVFFSSCDSVVGDSLEFRRVLVRSVSECSVHPISSRDKNDSQSSTEEVSQLFTSTSRGAFPQK